MDRRLIAALALSLITNGVLVGVIAGHTLASKCECKCRCHEQPRPPRRFPTGWVLPDDEAKPTKPTGERR